jgi:rubredoxin
MGIVEATAGVNLPLSPSPPNAPGSALAPIPMRLHCPACHELHVDEGEFATTPHHTHACEHCGNVWRPAVVNTVGVRFLFRTDKS